MSTTYQAEDIKLSKEAEKAFDHVDRHLLTTLLLPCIILVAVIVLGVTLIKVTVPQFQQAEIETITKTLTQIEETRVENPSITIPETPVRVELSRSSGERTVAIIPETAPSETLVTAEEAQNIYLEREKDSQR